MKTATIRIDGNEYRVNVVEDQAPRRPWAWASSGAPPEDGQLLLHLDMSRTKPPGILLSSPPARAQFVTPNGALHELRVRNVDGPPGHAFLHAYYAPIGEPDELGRFMCITEAK